MRSRLLGESADPDPVVVSIVRALLTGALQAPVYAKWQGLQWVLAARGDLGYLPADSALCPLRDRVLGTWPDPMYSGDVPVAYGRSRRYSCSTGVIGRKPPSRAGPSGRLCCSGWPIRPAKS